MGWLLDPLPSPQTGHISEERGAGSAGRPQVGCLRRAAICPSSRLPTGLLACVLWALLFEELEVRRPSPGRVETLLPLSTWYLGSVGPARAVLGGFHAQSYEGSTVPIPQRKG